MSKGEIRKTGEKWFMTHSISGGLIEIEESLGWIRITDHRGGKDWLGCTKPIVLSFTTEDAEILAAAIQKLCTPLEIKR